MNARTLFATVALAISTLGAPRAYAQMATDESNAAVPMAVQVVALDSVAPDSAAPAPQTLGPTLAGERIAFHEPVPATLATGSNFDGSRFGKGPTLMVVGGAVLIVGLIVGNTAGDIIAVAGGGLAVYGLYVFLSGNNETNGHGQAVGVGYRFALPH